MDNVLEHAEDSARQGRKRLLATFSALLEPSWSLSMETCQGILAGSINWGDEDNSELLQMLKKDDIRRLLARTFLAMPEVVVEVQRKLIISALSPVFSW